MQSLYSKFPVPDSPPANTIWVAPGILSLRLFVNILFWAPACSKLCNHLAVQGLGCSFAWGIFVQAIICLNRTNSFKKGLLEKSTVIPSTIESQTLPRYRPPRALERYR